MMLNRNRSCFINKGKQGAGQYALYRGESVFTLHLPLNENNVGAVQHVAVLQVRNRDLSARRRAVGIEIERMSRCVEPEFLRRVGRPGCIRNEMRWIQ